MKCPLGKGTLEIQFNKLDLIRQNNETKNENYGYKNDDFSKLTNTNTNYNNTNFMSQSNVSNNLNNDYIKEKEEQIKELKTKIDYYEEENNELIIYIY